MRTSPPPVTVASSRLVAGAWRRASVVLLAALFLATQVLVAVHTATVMHAVCPEHGETVHVEGGHGEVHALDDAPHGPTVGGAIPPGDEHLHDLCAVCATQRIAVALTPPLVLRWRAQSVERAQAPPVAPSDHPGIAVWLIAPKHSPPV
jgi:hypothetical protein